MCFLSTVQRICSLQGPKQSHVTTSTSAAEHKEKSAASLGVNDVCVCVCVGRVIIKTGSPPPPTVSIAEKAGQLNYSCMLERTSSLQLRLNGILL